MRHRTGRRPREVLLHQKRRKPEINYSELINAPLVLAAASDLGDITRLQAVLAAKFSLFRNLTLTTAMCASVCFLLHY
jgi:hypothetical protein